MRLKDRVAIVTGAAQGIGEAYATRLAREGARVVVADIQTEKGEGVAKSLRDAGAEASYVYLDVTKEDAVSEMASRTIDQFGRIDILVNNAALYYGIKLTPLLESDLAYWNRVFEVNLTGVFLCCKAVAPYMIQQKSGKIVNQSSAGAYGGRFHYSIAKLGVIGLTIGLAKELGPHGINVNAIAPGPILTEATLASGGGGIPAMAAQMPLRRAGSPEDLVGTVVWLVSDDSDWVTGQTISADGGLITTRV